MNTSEPSDFFSRRFFSVFLPGAGGCSTGPTRWGREIGGIVTTRESRKRGGVKHKSSFPINPRSEGLRESDKERGNQGAPLSQHTRKDMRLVATENAVARPLKMMEDEMQCERKGGMDGSTTVDSGGLKREDG